jgi:hypothetical protein
MAEIGTEPSRAQALKAMPLRVSTAENEHTGSDFSVPNGATALDVPEDALSAMLCVNADQCAGQAEEL